MSLQSVHCQSIHERYVSDSYHHLLLGAFEIYYYLCNQYIVALSTT